MRKPDRDMSDPSALDCAENYKDTPARIQNQTPYQVELKNQTSKEAKDRGAWGRLAEARVKFYYA
jgi:hypothetical protein